MTTAIEILTNLSVILLLGILVSLITTKLRMSNVLFLIFTGIALKFVQGETGRIFEFPLLFVSSIALIALVTIVFDSTSKLKFYELGKVSFSAFKLTLFVILLVMAIFSLLTQLITDINNFLMALLFASIMIGTDPSTVLSILGNTKNKVIRFLTIESILNTPLTVIFPFVVLNYIQTVGGLDYALILKNFLPFLQQIVTGIGTGMVVGLIVFRIMKKQYSAILSPLTLLTSSLLTYVLAELLKGNGVLAVTTLGILFGNLYLREKKKLQFIGSTFSNLFEILVFILLGLSIEFPTNLWFYIKSIVLFIIYLGVRYVSAWLSFRKEYNKKELIFISLNTSKGVAVATILFVLIKLGSTISGITEIINLGFAFIIYSVAISTIISHYSKYFLGNLEEKSKT